MVKTMVNKCQWCGKNFKPNRSKRTTKYCSKECRLKGFCSKIRNREYKKVYNGTEKNYIDGNCRVKTNKLYRTYRAILQRCYNPKDAGYNYYGGRGIICEWESYLDFKKDMEESFKKHLDKHGSRNTSIDRIDVDGNYCKENCRWSTQKEQANNTRRNLKVEYQGRILNIHQLSNKTKFNLSPSTVASWIRKGYTAEDIVYLPLNSKGYFSISDWDISFLKDRDKEIVIMNSKGFNYRLIGETLGITRERVRQILKRVKDKCRPKLDKTDCLNNKYVV